MAQEPEYFTLFRSHVAQFQQHIQGDDAQPLFPSAIHPNAYWSPSEKNKFFHALAVHSRLRPELIAASIKTKSTFDVCVYIDALDEAAESSRMECIREDLEGAFEIPDDRIAWEEENASFLAATETQWEANMREKMWVEGAEGSTGSPILPEDHEERKHISRRETIMMALSTVHLDLLEQIVENADTSTPQMMIPVEPAAQQASPSTHPWDESLIDPALLSSTPSRLNSSTQNQPQASSSSLQQPFDAPPSVTLPIVADAPTQPIDVEHTLRLMSPRSRLRHQKRLYMRRKRAEARGIKHVTLPFKLSTAPKPKKKEVMPQDPAKTSKSPRKKIAEQILELAHKQEQEDDDQGATKIKIDPSNHPNNWKNNLRTRKLFLVNGIDASYLNTNHLGLFHLSCLGRLMRLFRAGYGDDTDDTSFAISAEAIRLLSTIVVEFTSEIMRQTIVVREMEKQMKSSSKVWGTGHDKIGAQHIKYSLEMMGSGSSTKKDYFNRLLGDYEDDPVAKALHSAVGGGTRAIELNPPYIYLPKNLTSSENTETTLPEEDEFLAGDQEINEVLNNESEIDAKDAVIANKLWNEVEKELYTFNSKI